MSGIRIGENESLDSALERFKRQCVTSSILEEHYKREHHGKPSVCRKEEPEEVRHKRRKY